MTKQSYEAAAKIVQQIYAIHCQADDIRRLSVKEKKARQLEAKAVCTAFVLFFRDDNPRFDQERFMKACGVEL